MSPYIVTTKQPCPYDCASDPEVVAHGCDECNAYPDTPLAVSRRAAAALNGAQGAWAIIEADLRARRAAIARPTLSVIVQGGGRPHLPGSREIMAAITESGGSVGPLPDGTVIEVERVKMAELAAMVPRLLEDGENVIAAYNEAQVEG